MLALLHTGTRASEQVDPFWTANGTVYASLRDGNTLYIGGDFTYVGPDTGNWLALDSAGASHDSAWPKVHGTVYAAIPDGNGGWYLGGDFLSIGDTAVNRIAHINADKTLDGAFSASANATVWNLARIGNTLYVGGQFTTLGGQSRTYLGAVDAATGALSAWNPAVNSIVYALAVNGTTLYAGGSFTSLGGQARNRIAAIDTTTGNVTAWNPNSGSTVFVIVPDGSLVYVGGSFTTLGGQTRNRIAALNSTTGAATGWNPNASSNVRAILPSGGLVYVGGAFTTLGGQTRNRLAVIDATTGAATAWNPNAGGVVRALALDGNTVYAGGTFTTLGGQTRNRIAAIDATTGNPTSWDPNAGGNVYALTVQGTAIFAGGAFDAIGGKARARLAAIDLTTGGATDWDPNITHSNTFITPTVYSLALDGSTLYAGGTFDRVGGITRNNLAAIDTTDGSVTGWDPNVTGALFATYVYTLAIDQDVVYAGGFFTTAGGLIRNNIAALDKTSGAPTAWNANAIGAVRTLLLDGTTLYTGGEFTTIGGAARNYLAALDTGSGAALAWNPSADFDVYTLADGGETLYAGGAFTAIGGDSRIYLAEIGKNSGLATVWDPGADGWVYALALSDSNLYAGGDFTSIAGLSHAYVAAIDRDTGTPTAWDPGVDTSIRSLSFADNALYLGGYYQLGWSTIWQGLTGLAFTPPEAAAGPAGDVYGVSQTVTLTCTDHSGDGCATLYYTLDGSTPTRASAVYSDPLTIAANTTLRFFASDNDGIDGTVQTESYVIDATPPDTTATPSAGSYDTLLSVTLTCADDNSGCNATYYSLDGSTPDTSSTPYTEPFTLFMNTVVRFFSVDNAGNAETVQNADYFINTPPSVYDGTFATAEDSAVEGLLSADDLQGDTLSFSITTGPAQGSVSLTDAATGAFRYTPDPDSNGTDSFTFTVSDGQSTSNTATVTITIAPVNDPVTLQDDGVRGIVTQPGREVAVSFITVDDDAGDTPVYTATFISTGRADAAIGSANISDGRLTFRAAATGSDDLTITVTDSGGLSDQLTVPVTVLPALGSDSNDDGLSDLFVNARGLDAFAANGDSDGDGIPDTLEMGSTRSLSDRDGDGVIDALEAGAAADDANRIDFRVPATTAERLALPALSDRHFALSADHALTAHNNGQLGIPLYAESQLDTPDAEYDFPYGIFDFSVAAPDGTATVTVQLPEDFVLASDMAVRKRGMNGWRTVESAFIDPEAHSITFRLTDNGELDLDPSPGVIRDPVGLTIPASQDAYRDSENGGGGSVEPLWLLMLLAWRITRPSHSPAKRP